MCIHIKHMYSKLHIIVHVSQGRSPVLEASKSSREKKNVPILSSWFNTSYKRAKLNIGAHKAMDLVASITDPNTIRQSNTWPWHEKNLQWGGHTNAEAPPQRWPTHLGVCGGPPAEVAHLNRVVIPPCGGTPYRRFSPWHDASKVGNEQLFSWNWYPLILGGK